MYASTRFSSTLAAVYFILLIVIGNFILFNLLIAIIIQGFADTKAQKDSAQGSDKGVEGGSPTQSPPITPRERAGSVDSPSASPSKKPQVLLRLSEGVAALRDGFFKLPPVAAVVQFNADRSE